MKKRILLLSMVASINLFALDINEAINIALNNNNDIKKQEYIYTQSKENVRLNKSNFLPKFDLSYDYYDRNKGDVQTNSTASAVLSYNLFNGLGDYHLLKGAKFEKESSKYELKALKQDIIFNVKSAYLGFLDKRKELKTSKSAYELFKKQYKDSKNRFEQGLIAKNELLDVHVKMLNAMQNLTKAKSDFEITRYELSNILGGVDLSQKNIEELSENYKKNFSYNINELDNRSEIKALENSIKSLSSNMKKNKSSYMPKVDASLSYNKFGDDINPSDSTYDEQKMARVSFNWNLYNGGKDNTNVKISRLKISQTKEDLIKTKLNIKLQYNKAKSQLDVAKQNLDTAKLALEQAKENYKIVSDKFDEGIVKAVDLTDANYLLTNAKQQYYKAYYDEFLAISKLQRVFEKGEF